MTFLYFKAVFQKRSWFRFDASKTLLVPVEDLAHDEIEIRFLIYRLYVLVLETTKHMVSPVCTRDAV